MPAIARSRPPSLRIHLSPTTHRAASSRCPKARRTGESFAIPREAKADDRSRHAARALRPRDDPEDLLELCGPGKYRIEALDEYGNPLSCISTVTVGPDASPPELVANSNQRAHAANDMRFAMETIAQMSRSHSDSLQSLASSQADWIKMLPPRSRSHAMAPCSSRRCQRELAGWKRARRDPSWLKLLQPAMPTIVNTLIRNLGSWLGRRLQAGALDRGADETSQPVAARDHRRARAREKVAPTFDEHVVAVCALLTPDERTAATQILNEFIRPLFADMFMRTTPQQGAEFIRSLITKAVEQAHEQLKDGES